MKKDENDELKVDVEKYRHLDNASLEDFMYEFLIRNKEFDRDWKRLTKRRHMNYDLRIQLFEKYRAWVEARQTDRLFTRLQIEQKPKVYFSPLIAFRIFPRDYKKNSEAVVSIEAFRKDEPEKSAWTNYSIGLNDRRLNDHWSDVERLLLSLLGVSDSSGDYAAGDTLVLKINLNSSMEKIREEITGILSLYKTKYRRVKKEWKYYLIAYDLKDELPSLTYEKMASLLDEAFQANEQTFDAEGNEKTFDAKMCRNYYRKALHLINGGYRDFI